MNDEEISTNQQGMINDPTGLVRGAVLSGCILLAVAGGLAQESTGQSARLSKTQAAELVAISPNANDDKSIATAPAVQPASYRDLLKRVTPSVVSVFPERLVTIDDEEGALSRFFGREKGSEKDDDSGGDKDREERMGVGSGVILSADGWIVTNSHVVHLRTGKLADSASVELHNRKVYKAIIVGADPQTDIALLKIEAANLAPIELGDSDDVMTGDLVFAVGNPFKLGMTATMGMVSATQRTSLNLNGQGGYESFIQTDASINPGNSGGALVDGRGRLIGINTAIYNTGAGNIGLGFAVPTRLMSEVVKGLAENGEMRRGFFGIQIGEVNQNLAEQAGAKEITGAYVADLMKGGPAEKAGLKIGDVITHADGREMSNRGSLRVAFSCVEPGESIGLTLVRSGKERKVTVTAVAGPSVENATESLFTIDPLAGLKFRISELGLEVAEKAESKSSEAGKKLEVGMVIVSINGRTIESAEDATAALRKGVNKVVTRVNDDERTLAVRID